MAGAEEGRGSAVERARRTECCPPGHGRGREYEAALDAEFCFDVACAQGTLDVMVQRTGEQGQGNVLFVQNNFYYDAFFLKAIVLNGACSSGTCPVSNGVGKYHVSLAAGILLAPR